jgi:hypothetical protein
MTATLDARRVAILGFRYVSPLTSYFEYSTAWSPRSACDSATLR